MAILENIMLGAISFMAVTISVLSVVVVVGSIIEPIEADCSKKIYVEVEMKR